MEPAALQPIVTIRRRSRVAWVSLFGLQAITLAVIVRPRPAPVPPAPSITTVIVPAPAPASIAVEEVIAAQPTASVRPACPPPSADAPTAASLTKLPIGMAHIVTAPTSAGWIAAWNGQALQLSLDGGRTFTRALDGEGDLRAATFDCFGRAIVIRGEKLGIREGTRESWVTIPHVRRDSDAPIALVGGGPDVIVVGMGTDSDTWSARIAVSPDLGHSWWHRDLVEYWETSDVSGRQDPDGNIHLVITTVDCMSDAVAWLRVTGGDIERDDLGSVGEVRLYGDIAINAGWSGVRWKRFGEAAWRPVRGLPDGANEYASDLLDGPIPRLLYDGALFTIARGRARKLREIDGDKTEWGAVDRAGRAWFLDGFGSSTSQILVR